MQALAVHSPRKRLAVGETDGQITVWDIDKIDAPAKLHEISRTAFHTTFAVWPSVPTATRLLSGGSGTAVEGGLEETSGLIKG